MSILQLGYKVQKWKFWATLLVALPLGFGLYYFKKFHRQIRTPPTLILPAFLILSFGAFSSKLGGVREYVCGTRGDEFSSWRNMWGHNAYVTVWSCAGMFLYVCIASSIQTTVYFLCLLILSSRT